MVVRAVPRAWILEMLEAIEHETSEALVNWTSELCDDSPRKMNGIINVFFVLIRAGLVSGDIWSQYWTSKRHT